MKTKLILTVAAAACAAFQLAAKPKAAKVTDTFKLKVTPGTITEIDLGSDRSMRFVYCPAGWFNMGYKEKPDISKERKVRISSPFWITKTLVSVDQLKSLGLDSLNTNLNERANISDVSIVVKKLPAVLTERFGKLLPPGYVFRLPTEAEFEYLQKAGTKDGDPERKWGYRSEKENVWGVEQLYDSFVCFLDRAPEYGRGVDVVNRRSKGTVWTDLEKVNYKHQPYKDPIGWTDSLKWSVFRRHYGGKFLTGQKGRFPYNFYFVVAPDVDKLNKFIWK